MTLKSRPETTPAVRINSRLTSTRIWQPDRARPDYESGGAGLARKWSGEAELVTVGVRDVEVALVP
jgi:hypothetical protein